MVCDDCKKEKGNELVMKGESKLCLVCLADMVKLVLMTGRQLPGLEVKVVSWPCEREGVFGVD
ncbi:hypothetical protein COT97_02365 [Candidatus Falkowbacteria bacterium CG10_big_fil_rev_8_21_14_0_10_39_11]|uniref:Uncharacterized protein n=1 Tax=Candidatus Falkowbacteria bacterium CG10_big_fil_rev_8_21_14_0_10_39_11 TaxID=1974565 RepID=A0A2H0V7I7_9BACT|nr:MAG: hypothetical protein COT97_02365 [Candidatus Falkowbacteria bacterium CG10_big_fil_rev_8_21_14_0_10_39_11]